MDESRMAARRALEEFRSQQPRETSSSGTRNADGYADALNSLETMEQSIMQHIRTAGLKKNRECAIIDEVLNLRKNRRQIFSNIVKDIHSLQEYSLTVESALADERENATNRSTKLENELREDVARLTSEVRHVREKHRIQIEELRESSRKSMAIEVAQVKVKYENKLRLLEERVFAIQTASRESEEERATKLRAREREETASQEQAKSVQRYKEALRAMVDREKSLERESKDLERRLERCEDEKG
jgi:hypothetical protein